MRCVAFLSTLPRILDFSVCLMPTLLSRPIWRFRRIRHGKCTSQVVKPEDDGFQPSKYVNPLDRSLDAYWRALHVVVRHFDNTCARNQCIAYVSCGREVREVVSGVAKIYIRCVQLIEDPRSRYST